MMAVYVDDARIRYGRMIMCHMLADTIQELLEMADRIGVHRRHFQPLSHPHFDICLDRRARAIAAGAQLINRRELVAIKVRQRERLQSDLAERSAYHTAALLSDKRHLFNTPTSGSERTAR